MRSRKNLRERIKICACVLRGGASHDFGLRQIHAFEFVTVADGSSWRNGKQEARIERIKERLNDGLAARGNADSCSHYVAREIFDLTTFLFGTAVFSEADAPPWFARRC